MSIYKPSELHLFLNELGISPKKGLSQNFLIDGNILRKIVKLANVQPDDVVLEIGSGPGSLTQVLLEAKANVIAVEKDTILSKALERLQTAHNSLQIYCKDILDFPLEEKLPKDKKIKVIANLPYNVTTPILTYLISKRHLFSSFTVMVQEEVARRFTAVPGSKEYGSITVFLNFFTNPKYGFSVSRRCFFPAPRVDSAVVHLDVKEGPLLNEDETGFFKMTRHAFEHRRKMLRSSLKEMYPNISIALETARLNPLARPEDLSVVDFFKLFQALNLVAGK